MFLPSCSTKSFVMATPTKPSTFLIFPWGLLSVVLILLLNTAFSNFFGKNWSWIALVLVIPAAILENLKVGYSTMRIMFLKTVYSLLSFLVVGMAFGAAISRWYLVRFEDKPGTPGVHIPWYVLLALFVMLMIEIVQLFSMLKAVKREFMQFDPDN
jgi:hypothetical protein